MSEPLKSCPFCGAPWTVTKFTYEDKSNYQPSCTGCPALINAEFATEEEVVKAANHRPGEAAVAEECAKIVEEPSGHYLVGHRRLPYWDGEAKAAEIRKRFGEKSARQAPKENEC